MGTHPPGEPASLGPTLELLYRSAARQTEQHFWRLFPHDATPCHGHQGSSQQPRIGVCHHASQDPSGPTLDRRASRCRGLPRSWCRADRDVKPGSSRSRGRRYPINRGWRARQDDRPFETGFLPCRHPTNIGVDPHRRSGLHLSNRARDLFLGQPRTVMCTTLCLSQR